MIPVDVETLKKTLNLEAVENDDVFEKNHMAVLAEITYNTEKEHYEQALTDTDEDESRVVAFESAYCSLMFVQVADLLNLRASECGFVASTGFDESKVAVLSPEQVSSMQKARKLKAYQVLLPYLNSIGRMEYRRLTGNREGSCSSRIAVI